MNRYMVTQGGTFLLTGETTIEAITACGGIRSFESHENLALKQNALAAQGIVDIASEVPSLIKVADLLLSRLTLSKRAEDTICVALPLARFRCRSAGDRLNTLNTVQRYNILHPMIQILDQHHSAKQQNTRLYENNWTEAAQYYIEHQSTKPSF